MKFEAAFIAIALNSSTDLKRPIMMRWWADLEMTLQSSATNLAYAGVQKRTVLYGSQEKVLIQKNVLFYFFPFESD